MVGEGGCPPDYFMRRMSAGEANAYLDGLQRRKRDGWERTRALMRLVYSGFGGKGDMGMDFPWDGEDEAEEAAPPTEEEMARMREMAAAMQEQLKNLS